MPLRAESATESSSGSAARGTILGLAGQAWHLLTALLLYALLARRLGPALFGQWGVVLSLLSWFEIFVMSAVVRATTKAISERPGDLPKIGKSAYAAQLGIGAAVTVALVVTSGAMARALGDPSLAVLLRVSALDIVPYAAFMAASAVVLGQRRFERQALAWLVYASAKAALIAAFVVFGFSITGALIGNALSSFVGLAAMFVPLGPSDESVREMLGRAVRMTTGVGPYLSLSLLEGIEQKVDLWLASAVLVGGVLTGYYASAAKLAEIPMFLFLGLNRVIFPEISAARASGDSTRVAETATQAVRATLIVTVLALSLAVSVGRQMLELVFSSAYLGAFVPLTLLMAAAIGRTLRSTCSEVLMAQDRKREALLAVGEGIVLEVGLVVLLSRRFGIAGAAGGAAAAALLAGAGGGYFVRREIGWRPVASLARSLAAGAVIAAALVALAPRGFAAVVAAAVGAVAYAALLVAFGEVDERDRATLRDSLRRPPRQDRSGVPTPRPTVEPAPRRTLIVNADDFGWSRGIDLGIVEAHTGGIVTAASLLATGASFDHAAELGRATPTLDIGVHLEFYRGEPVLDPALVPTLVDAEGRFLGSWEAMVGRLMAGRIDHCQMAAEFRAQIERIVAAGIKPTHVDSEKHLHLWPSLFDVVCSVASEFGISRVRIVREPPSRRAIPAGLTALSFHNARTARRHGMAVCDGTIGVTEPPTEPAVLERLLSSARGRRVELIVHPGHLDDQFRQLQTQMPNRLIESREEEWAVLASPGSHLLVERYGFTLDGRGEAEESGEGTQYTGSSMLR